jgi:uncharacterized delta-60 repeat protein
MKPLCAYALLLMVSLPAAPALGAPGGELDPAFGDHGRVLLRDPPFDEISGVDVFVDPGSGKFLVVGDGYYYDDRLLRFNGDGSLDQGFGNQGSVQLDFGNDDLSIYDVQWLADGKLLIAGALNVHATPDNVSHSTALLARVHADGTPDVSFGNAGRAVLQLGGVYESVSEVLLQPDGRIVVFGYTNRTDSGERILMRYTKDGALDSGFGNSATPGVSVVHVQGVDAQLAAIEQQSDDNFLICGDATLRPGGLDAIDIVAIRVQPDGTPDSTFGNNGMLLIDGGQDSIGISACRELADGHVIFVGSAGSDERQRAAAWRMTPDGRLDAGFGANGLMVLDTDTPSMATAMLILADGSIAIAGSQWKPSDSWQGDKNPELGWSDMLVSRFDPTSGEIDIDFGDRGQTVVDFGAHEIASNAYSASLKQQPDGKLLILGAQVDWYDWYPWFSIAIARVDPYGSGSNGWASMIDSFLFAPAATGEVELRLRRTGGSTGQLTIDYRTAAGTAIAGQDYVDTSGIVTWSDGDMGEKTISIAVLNPGQHADGRNFHVELLNSNGGLGLSRAMIHIRSSNSPGGGGGGNPSDGNGATNGADNGGGGAIGIELWLLMVLGVSGVARHYCLDVN